MKNLSSIIFLFFSTLIISEAKAQDRQEDSNLNRDSVLYKKSWALGARVRSDGFCVNAEFTKSKRFTRSLLYQAQFSYYIHPKQTRQQSQYSGGGFLSGDGIRPFVYGKQNTLFSFYGGVGQKFLLAEKGKKNGVQLLFKYAAGLNLAILKPYSLRVIPEPLTTATMDDLVDVTYEKGVNNSFLDYDRIVGYSGFGKGWKIKVLPALHLEVGMEFDFGKNLSIIKTLEIGVASDFYYKRVPVVVVESENKFLYPSVYLGFLMGKRKER